MRHLSAYLMLVLGGNDSPSAADVSKVLSAVGVESVDAEVEKLIAAVEGKVCSSSLAVRRTC